MRGVFLFWTISKAHSYFLSTWFWFLGFYHNRMYISQRIPATPGLSAWPPHADPWFPAGRRLAPPGTTGWWMDGCGSTQAAPKRRRNRSFHLSCGPNLELGNLGMTWGQGLEGMAGPTEAQAGCCLGKMRKLDKMRCGFFGRVWVFPNRGIAHLNRMECIYGLVFDSLSSPVLEPLGHGLAWR